jgi:hypothetical protein
VHFVIPYDYFLDVDYIDYACFAKSSAALSVGKVQSMIIYMQVDPIFMRYLFCASE